MTDIATQLNDIRAFLKSTEGYSSQKFKDLALSISREMLDLEWTSYIENSYIIFEKSSLTTDPVPKTKIQYLSLHVIECQSGHIQIFCHFYLGLGYNKVTDITLSEHIAKRFNGKTGDYGLAQIPYF